MGDTTLVTLPNYKIKTQQHYKLLYLVMISLHSPTSQHNWALVLTQYTICTRPPGLVRTQYNTGACAIIKGPPTCCNTGYCMTPPRPLEGPPRISVAVCSPLIPTILKLYNVLILKPVVSGNDITPFSYIPTPFATSGGPIHYLHSPTWTSADPIQYGRVCNYQRVSRVL